MRLVQVKAGDVRRVAVVEEPNLRLLRDFDSVYTLAQAAIANGGQLSNVVNGHLTGDCLDYDEVYSGASAWKLLPPIDHPEEAGAMPGFRHRPHPHGQRARPRLHAYGQAGRPDRQHEDVQLGSGGRPALFRGDRHCAGVVLQRLWLDLRAHGDPLQVPPYAEDGGEEAEIAVLYVIGPDGRPYRVGMAQGNEFSDHRFEKRNYLNLAGSKLRTCSLGPELAIHPDFRTAPGTVSITRDGKQFWSHAIASGEEEMVHSLRNMEHHHFKFELHRRPGDVHVHFLGAHSLSFGKGSNCRMGM